MFVFVRSTRLNAEYFILFFCKYARKNVNLNLNYCPVSVMSVVPMGSIEFLMSTLTGIR